MEEGASTRLCAIVCTRTRGKIVGFTSFTPKADAQRRILTQNRIHITLMTHPNAHSHQQHSDKHVRKRGLESQGRDPDSQAYLSPNHLSPAEPPQAFPPSLKHLNKHMHGRVHTFRCTLSLKKKKKRGSALRQECACLARCLLVFTYAQSIFGPLSAC